MPELAIAIVHYRAEELLARSMEALAASTFDDFAAVVVDNGSLAALRSPDSRIRLVNAERNLGFAAATNRALGELPGETRWVLLLNPDVIVEPSTLEETLRPLRDEPRVGAVTCRLTLPSGEVDPACRRSEPTPFTALAKQLGLQRFARRIPALGRYNLMHLDDTRPHAIDAASGAYLMIRRQALERAGGGLDERFFLYGEDLDLCRRLRGSGSTLLYWPRASALHVKGSGRIRAMSTTLHFYRAMWTYYRKWGHSRTNPLVLGPLGLGLATLGATESVRNAVQRLFRAPPGV